MTDSGSEVRFSEDKPGVSNLMSIYGCVTGKTMEEIEREFDGKGSAISSWRSEKRLRMSWNRCRSAMMS